MVSSKVVFLV